MNSINRVCRYLDKIYFFAMDESNYILALAAEHLQARILKLYPENELNVWSVKEYRNIIWRGKKELPKFEKYHNRVCKF
jgi:hypothetical protein